MKRMMWVTAVLLLLVGVVIGCGKKEVSPLEGREPKFNILIKKEKGEWKFYGIDEKVAKKPITYTDFKHLRPKEGVDFKIFITGWAGGDEFRYFAGKYQDGYAVLNPENAGYFFQPIDSKEAAYELVLFLRHKIGLSEYEREFIEIHNKKEYQELKSRFSAQEEVASVPTYSPKIEKKDDSYIVERLFGKFSGKQRIIYEKYQITQDGEMKVLESKIIAQGTQEIIY